MSSNQLSYNLLPADKLANTNFRHLFLSLSFLEALLTSCNATLCLLLSIYIYTRQPFILLHTSFHPFIQASIFLIASVAQFFKLLTLLFCVSKIIINDGDIFTACAQVEIEPNLELVQIEKSPNDVARKCFKSRQRQVKNLRSVLRLYPLIQLLCGTLSLAFWCTSDERHMVTPVYYRLLQQTQGPSNVVFVFYLTTWCIDLILTPLFCLITTWHYARVDWQIQLLAAQETMDYNLHHANRIRDRQLLNRRRAKIASRKKKNKIPKRERIKAVLSPFSPSKLAKVDEQYRDGERDKNKEKNICDVHTMHTPLSVPVSPSTSSSSNQDDLSSDPSHNGEKERSKRLGSMTSTQREGGESRYNIGQRLMRMTASIGGRSRSASVDPSSFSRSLHRAITPSSERRSAISAYLNVEGADEVTDITCDSLQRQDESDSFRICIQADDTSRSFRS